MTSNESSILDIDILDKLKSDIKSEWQGDEPGINFFLLLAALLLFIIWAIFSVFFFSRVAGLLVGFLLKRLISYTLGDQNQLRHFSIGSFSVSLLAGKLMFRDIIYMTDDYSIRINDGWVIFSYWRSVPKKIEVEMDKNKGMTSSRLHVSLNGVKMHVFNRLDVYQMIAKQRQGSAAAHFASNTKETATTLKQNAFTNFAQKVEDRHIEEWWDKFWRLVGNVVFDISSCRLIAGNHRMPYAFAITFENYSSKIYICEASNAEDRYMIRVTGNMENARISLVKQSGYVTSDFLRQDPPRTMGDGFAILQSANIQFFYLQDILGLVRNERHQTTTTNIPVWETTWRLHKNTIISYGPFADKQRDLLYGFFFPSDYAVVPVNEMPKIGERRILIQHTTRISFMHDATIDIWFMRSDELNAIHSRAKQGSSIEFTIPWICAEDGYKSVTNGTFIFLEMTTTLPFREFIECELAQFSLTVHFPRAYNAHQVWDFGLQFHRIKSYIVWDHKRFLTDLIDEWAADDRPDLCGFVPYTWNFNINIIDQFEVILLLNDKNWIDTSTTEFAENTQIAIVGNQLLITFGLPFTEFGSKTIDVHYDIKAFSQLALRVRIPPQSPLEPIFSALTASSSHKQFMQTSEVFVSAGPEQGFVEIWRTDCILITLDHTYHPVYPLVTSDLPEHRLLNWLPKQTTHPSQLVPDRLETTIKMSESEIALSGLIVRLIFDLKDNYFGNYDQISDVNSLPNGSVTVKFTPPKTELPEQFRPMDVKLRMQVENLRAHCLIFSSKSDDETPETCPIVFNEQIAVELSKVHSEALVQVQLAPTIVYFAPHANGRSLVRVSDASLPPLFGRSTAGWLALEGFQFRGHGYYSDIEVPWKMEIMEYAWLVEIIVGELSGNLQPNHLSTAVHFFESFLLLSLFPDEVRRLPEKYNICHHFEHLRSCSKSNLRIPEPTGGISKCLSSEAIKYKIARVSVDSVGLLVGTDEFAVHLSVEDVRFAFCNSHLQSYAENLTLCIPRIELKQLVHHPTRDVYLECGRCQINQIDLDIRLPTDVKASYLPEEKKQFLRKHDRTTNSLYFLWQKDQQNKRCGCNGNCRFFATEDISGAQFSDSSFPKMAIPQIHRSKDTQAGFMQSIVDTTRSGIRLEEATESPHRVFKSQVSTESKVGIQRKLSDSSYKSATSQTPVELSLLLDNYAHYMDVFEIRRSDVTCPEFTAPGVIGTWVEENGLRIVRTIDGVGGVRLKRKTERHLNSMALQRASTFSNDGSSTEESKFVEDFGRDPFALYARGNAAETLEVFISPLAVEVASRFAIALTESITSTHPAVIAQRSYLKCALSIHSQPLNCAANKTEAQMPKPMIHLRIGTPTINIGVFQSEPALSAESMNSIPTDFTSTIVLLSLQPSKITAEAERPTPFLGMEKRASSQSSGNLRVPEMGGGFASNILTVKCFFESVNIQLLHLIGNQHYDQNVYAKIPLSCTTSWSDLPIAQRIDSNLRTLCEIEVPSVDFHLVLNDQERMTDDAQKTPPRSLGPTEKTEKINRELLPQHNLVFTVGPIQLTTILGKPMETTATEMGIELSLYEVLSPLLNIWIHVGSQTARRIELIGEVVEEWNDLSFTKLLADALDWRDDDAAFDKRSKMDEVRLHGKQFDSCPSCKLILFLMRYVAKNGSEVQNEYWPDVLLAVDDFRDRQTRKLAMIALLSHWQTVITPQIQLCDNHVAQKYRCQIPVTDEMTITLPPASAVAVERKSKESEITTYPPVADSNQLLSNAEAFSVHGPIKLLPVGKSESHRPLLHQQSSRLRHSISTPRFSADEATSAVLSKSTAQRVMGSGHKRQGSAASAAGFTPGHRRGPSTVTQATMTTDTQPRTEDLYWILRAQKELRQRGTKVPVEPPITHEVNPMELLLDVFFWSVYEQRSLYETPFEAEQSSAMGLSCTISLASLKLDVIERRLLRSGNSQPVVSVNCHHLLSIDTIELKGGLVYHVEMDSLQIRPLRIDLVANYTTQVQNIRVITSLPSIFLIGEIAAAAQICSQSAPSTSFRPRDPTAVRTDMSNDRWTLGVLDKMSDYRRYAEKIQQPTALFAMHVTGKWTTKTLLVELMLSELFVSTTMLRVDFSHTHRRLLDSNGPHVSNPAVPTATSQAADPTVVLSRDQEDALKPLDTVNLEVKRANLIFSEHRQQRAPAETKQILNCALRAATFNFDILSDHRKHLLLILGEIEGELPMAAQSIHEVLLRHAPSLNKQLHRVFDDRSRRFPFDYTSVLSPYTQRIQRRHSVHFVESANTTVDDVTLIDAPAIINSTGTPIDFELQLTSLEITAQLLPSLRTKYAFSKAASNGRTGPHSRFKAELLDHRVFFIVHEATAHSPPIDTFTLPLPYIRVEGSFRNDVVEKTLTGPNTRLIYKPGGFFDVTVEIGSVTGEVSTDLLNQILFAERSFRSELTFLLERLSVERPTSSLPASKPIHFNLTVQGVGAPWLQLTASTPTATAIRFTIDGPTAVLTNRLALRPTGDSETEQPLPSTSQPERLFGRAKVQLNVTLGQLCKTAMYEEAKEELQEYATFMTQVSAHNEEITVGQMHNYIIHLNRPILLVKASAIDKAILLWLNYRNAYNYWRQELILAGRGQQHAPTPKSHDASTPTTSSTNVDMQMNLSLSIQGGLYCVMPLFNEESDDNMAALLVSLQRSDVSVCIQKELACQAKFEAFKISFVDNFDEHSLSDAWLQENTGDTTRSNFLYFPEGSYHFCSSANAPKHPNENAQWVLSVRAEMEGMLIDFDNRIGKLMNLCAHTLASFAEDVGPVDEIPVSETSSSVYGPRSSVTRPEPTPLVESAIINDTNGTFDDMNRLAGYENKIRWLERRMHEQSVRVTELLNDGKSEYELEIARNKLRVYELARFKQFRRSMLERFRPRLTTADGVPSARAAVGHLREVVAAQPPEGAVSLPPPSNVTTANTKTESVDLNIDVQIKIETGHCILRATPTTSLAAHTQKALTKRTSARDLKNKTGWSTGPSTVTRLQIPSLDAKLFYTSDDSVARLPSQLHQTFASSTAANQRSTGKCLYLALELAKMLEQTLVTPALADFLEQAVEPLPESLFEPTTRLPSTPQRSESTTPAVPIVAIDTSVLPLDFFFHMTVYSSVIRFEGGEQQRSSSAADCLLTLPSLTLLASTRRQNEQDASLAGIYLSATLSNFELSIYSPHQQTTAHDALSLKLDRLAITASRTKNPAAAATIFVSPSADGSETEDVDRHTVQLVIIASVGCADFNYDMRRLGELLCFPKPWYRKKLIQRLFFGEQSLVRKTSTSSTRSIGPQPTLSVDDRRSPASNTTAVVTAPTKRSEWAAALNFVLQWSELNVNAQMSNTMGETAWIVRNGIARGHFRLDSLRQRDVAIGFKLKSSRLNASGGAISGDISVHELRISARHTKRIDEPPKNIAQLQLSEVESRVEWMSRPIFIALLTQTQISLTDQWATHKNPMGKVEKAICSLNVRGSWSDLQMIITRNTTADFAKIAHKLVVFFNEQLRSGVMVWGREFERERDRHSDSSDTSASTRPRRFSLDLDSPVESPDFKSRRRFSSVDSTTSTRHPTSHWQRILDLLGDVQMHRRFLPLPTTSDGVTVAGGLIEFEAKRISLACMNGEMNAASWAFFHMKDASTLLACNSKFAFLDPQNSRLGVHTEQKFVFKLGAQTPTTTQSEAAERNAASVCRVQHSRNFLLRHNASVGTCLESVVGDVLKQLSLADKSTPRPTPPRHSHNVLELFIFPALDATLTTIQRQPIDLSSSPVHDASASEGISTDDMVESWFICEFHNAVSVQTDFNAQVGFLPELLKSYLHEDKRDESVIRSPAGPSASSTSASSTAVEKQRRDSRLYVCREWAVDPKIRFIDRFKWNPPVIDDILRKLQIFDHRTTIPKVMQRGVLDRSDAILAAILKQIIQQSLRS
ncbi:FSA-C domain-containing protein [Aphelenchoides besseyi]|nr:FSA-C domain-containing protein [Aphelenchoides besseyi]